MEGRDMAGILGTKGGGRNCSRLPLTAGVEGEISGQDSSDGVTTAVQNHRNLQVENLGVSHAGLALPHTSKHLPNISTSKLKEGVSVYSHGIYFKKLSQWLNDSSKVTQ